MTGTPFERAASISRLMYPRATQLSSPHEVRQRLIDSRMGSGRSPQKAQLTSITSKAGRLPNPARAPKPPAANTALSRSVRNLSHTRLVIDFAPFAVLLRGAVEPCGLARSRPRLIYSPSWAFLLRRCVVSEVGRPGMRRKFDGGKGSGGERPPPACDDPARRLASCARQCAG